MKTLIIGGGSMGYMFAESFLSAHLVRPNDLTILDHNPHRIELLLRQLNANVETYADSYIAEQNLIILAVKPQDSEQLCAQIRPYINEQSVFLSIMAGVRIATLAQHLGSAKIIRAMPNLPAQVGMGMTAFTANAAVLRNELTTVQNLLATTGRTIYFDDEQMIDAATAVSGSGPAYVYYFMQNMVSAAMQLGFTDSEAELMVWQTMLGALHLQNKGKLSCDEWIQRVASKGGTTEAALRVFDQQQMAATIQQGIVAAFARAEELGK